MKHFYILLLLIPFLLPAQTVYLDANHPVYRYLDKMEAKQVITGYRDAVKPLSRSVIAAFIIQIDTTSRTLTPVEQEEQFFYKEEFYQELEHLGYENLIEERWHLYRYQRGVTSVNFNAIAGFSYQSRPDGSFTRVISNGLQMYGYISSAFGISFSMRDNEEAGSSVSGTHPLTPDPAQVLNNVKPGHVYYDPTDVQVNWDLGFVTISAEKMHNIWGTGERGNVILSDKAPSYPQIKIRAHLSDDIDFTYLHGWLFSDILDSARMYQVPNVPGSLGVRDVYRSKYIAAHILEASLWDGVDIAVGESQIYASRNPEPMYLIPVMFFKAGEHWMKDTDNSQMFLTADINAVQDQNYHLSLFIDEIGTNDMFSAERQHNQIGFTVGGSWYDQLFSDTRLMLEYSRTNPWVYNHRFSDATFQSHGVNLGHWIGQNADLFTVKYSFRPFRSLEAGIFFESLRKGGKDSTALEYRLPTPTFLYGPLTKQQTFGIVGSWEPTRDVIVDFRVLRSSNTTEQTPTSFSFVNNPNDYSLLPEYRGKWDLFVGFRYNFD